MGRGSQTRGRTTMSDDTNPMTKLSALWLRLERYLRGRPGPKSSVTVQNIDHSLALIWDRMDLTWRLLGDREGDVRPVLECTIVERAALVNLVPQLLAELD